MFSLSGKSKNQIPCFPCAVATLSNLPGISVADPGFPRGGGANPKGGGAPTYYLANFSWKLHENEEILGQRGGARIPRAPPLDPPLYLSG